MNTNKVLKVGKYIVTLKTTAYLPVISDNESFKLLLNFVKLPPDCLVKLFT